MNSQNIVFSDHGGRVLPYKSDRVLVRKFREHLGMSQIHFYP